MKRRIVEKRDGTYQVQSRVLFYWVDGIWDGERYMDYVFHSPEQALEKVLQIEDDKHKDDIVKVIGVL